MTMTKAEFLTYLARRKVCVYVWPYDIAICTCGDINCCGWRLVPRKSPESWAPLRGFRRNEVVPPSDLDAITRGKDPRR